MLHKVNREERRKLHKMSKEKIIEEMPRYYMESYNDWVRDAFMSILLKLRDEFGFGNDRIQRLLKATETWMQACISGEDDIDAEGIKQQLIAEGITCLKDTDL